MFNFKRHNKVPIVPFMIFGNIARFKVLDAIELLEEKKD